MNLKSELIKMQATYQIPNKQTVLEHGISVYKEYLKIKKYLTDPNINDKPIFLPDLIIKNKDLFINLQIPDYIFKRYLILHDIGKPYCLIKDDCS